MKRIAVEPGREFRAIAEAAHALGQGQLVIFPAERLYGLAADARSDAAVERVFAAKGRSGRVPLPVIIGDAEEAEIYARVSARARALIEQLWPGPLTLVLRYRMGLAKAVMAGTGMVGLRAPGNWIARELCRTLGGPLIATSANPSGDESCASLDELDPALADAVAVALDVGPLAGPPGSTVLQVTKYEATILREGAISRELIRTSWKGVGLK
jgi:L-threonylcarbamoyladenylate synthase